MGVVLTGVPRNAGGARGFAARIVAWQRRHGRHDLPWQRSRDPYRVWVSEIMLQQTQVLAVVPYYERFLARFPDVAALAAANEEEVLRLWSGLGYYARARNLHRAAQHIVGERGRRFPSTARELEALPGVGRSTAAAVAALAFGERAAILDGNVKRVLARVFAVDGWPGTPRVQRDLWALAERLLPRRDIEDYTQGLMDLGATVCTRTRPRCQACPVTAHCAARRAGTASQYPAPRPRRAVPVKSCTWLLMRHRGALAFVARPGAGLWGGLLVFPELPDSGTQVGSKAGKAIGAYCKSVFGVPPLSVRRLPPFHHVFTHFRLAVRPVLCELSPDAPRGHGGASLRWMLPAEAIHGPVPAPVRRLLTTLK